MTPEVAADLWRARFGDSWVASDKFNDPVWEEIFVALGDAGRLETHFPALAPAPMYKLKDPNADN